MEDEIRKMYAAYLEAFHTGDATRVAAFYHPPSLFITERGSLELPDRGATERFFANLIADLRARGFHHSEVNDLRVRLLSETLASVEGQAVRYARDGSVMERLGGLYTLQRVDGDWKFVAVVAYPPSS